MDRRALPLLAAMAAATVLGGCRPAPVSDGVAGTTTPPSVEVETAAPTVLRPEPPPVPADPATATTEVPGDEGPPVVLRGDGLGAHRFGDPADEVLAGLTLRWGPPDTDSGWIPAGGSAYGACPGAEMRAVGWRAFTVLVSDGPTPHGPGGRRHFFTWEYRVDDPAAPGPDPGGYRPPLHTEAGISVGATVADLRRAYGDRLELFEEAPAGESFGVQLGDGGLLFGSLTGLDPAGVVVSMVGGGGCGE